MLTLPQKRNPSGITLDPTDVSKITHFPPPSIDMLLEFLQRAGHPRPRVTVRQRDNLIIDKGTEVRRFITRTLTRRADHPLEHNAPAHRHHGRRTPRTVCSHVRRRKRGIVLGIFHDIQRGKERSNVPVVDTSRDTISTVNPPARSKTYKLKNVVPASGPFRSNSAVAFNHSHPIAPA